MSERLGFGVYRRVTYVRLYRQNMRKQCEYTLIDWTQSSCGKEIMLFFLGLILYCSIVFGYFPFYSSAATCVSGLPPDESPWP